MMSRGDGAALAVRWWCGGVYGVGVGVGGHVCVASCEVARNRHHNEIGVAAFGQFFNEN